MLINIGNNKFKVKVVFSQKDTSKGMMGKNFDNTFNGMLFFSLKLYSDVGNFSQICGKECVSGLYPWSLANQSDT